MNDPILVSMQMRACVCGQSRETNLCPTWPPDAAEGGTPGPKEEFGIRLVDESPGFELDEGVHIHWQLPRAFSHGIIRQGSSELSFPRVPNRWLVTRFSSDGTDTSWVVESDAEDKNGTPRLVRTNSSGQERLRLVTRGKNVKLEEWKGEEGKRGRERLTALSPGDVYFSSFYPNCRTIFGLHDAQRPAPGTTWGYQVVGWYADPNDDPLSKTADKSELAIALRSRLLKEDRTSSGALLLHGTVWGIGNEPNQAPQDLSSIVCGWGVTPGEVLGEQVANALRIQGEDLVRLKAFASHLADDAVVGKASKELQEELERLRFMPSRGGTLWELRKRKKKDGPQASEDGREATIEEASRVNKLFDDLVQVQKDHDATELSLNGKRQELHDAWSLGNGYDGRASDVKKLLTLWEKLHVRISDILLELRLAGAAILQEGESQPTQGDEAESARFQVIAHAAPPFYEPADPGVLLSSSSKILDPGGREDPVVRRGSELCNDDEVDHASQWSNTPLPELVIAFTRRLLNESLNWAKTEEAAPPFFHRHFASEWTPRFAVWRASTGTVSWDGLSPLDASVFQSVTRRISDAAGQQVDVDADAAQTEGLASIQSCAFVQVVGAFSSLFGKIPKNVLPPLDDDGFIVQDLVKLLGEIPGYRILKEGESVDTRPESLHVEKLWLVDAFGVSREVDVTNSWKLREVLPEPSRLRVGPEPLSVTLPDDPSGLGPVRGWILGNRFDHTLVFYRANGSPVGHLDDPPTERNATERKAVEWFPHEVQSGPGPEGEEPRRWVQVGTGSALSATKESDLGKLDWALQAFLHAFKRADENDKNTSPTGEILLLVEEHQRKSSRPPREQGMAAALGQPMAVVPIELRLETSTGTELLKLKSKSKYKYKVRVGSSGSADGVVAFACGSNTTENVWTLRKPGSVANLDDKIVLLVDPDIPATVQLGIVEKSKKFEPLLPKSRLEVSPQEFSRATGRFALVVRAAPILVAQHKSATQKGRDPKALPPEARPHVGPAVPVPPGHSGQFNWGFLERAKPEDQANWRAHHEACTHSVPVAYPVGPLTAVDGWLSLVPDESSDST